MDCCLCSPVVSIFRLPRNTICPSCYEGAKCILELSNKFDSLCLQEEQPDKLRTSPKKGLAQAFNQLEQSLQLGDSFLIKYKFLESLVVAFREEMPSDVELVPKAGPSIHAHRVVLATKSSVFKNMFEADECKMAYTGPIAIPEMSYAELKCFIEFLYSGSISEEHIQQHGHALLMAADKYDVRYLSDVCETHILNSIDSSNVLDVLELATSCSSAVLRETAINSIIKHQDEIIFSERYKEFALRNAVLSVEVTQALLRDMKAKAGIHTQNS